MFIESRQNERVKAARALSLNKERHARGLHRAEGEKLVHEAIATGQNIHELFVEDGFPTPSVSADTRLHSVTRSVLEAICDTRTPQHIVAIVQTPSIALPERYPAGLIVVLDGVQDPGNAGAILRSADAFGASGVLLAPDCADPFADKALRASMGSAYHLPIWRADIAPEIERMKAAGFLPLCGRLDGAEALPALPRCVALVIGSEGRGASPAVLTLCQGYRLHMPGRAESLNAAVAAGILLYQISKEMPV